MPRVHLSLASASLATVRRPSAAAWAASRAAMPPRPRRSSRSRAVCTRSSTICTVSLVLVAAWAAWAASFRTSSATTLNPLPSSPARAASIEALSASMCVCFAIALVWVTNLLISLDASASASASADPWSTSSASRASSAVLASSRSRCERAATARAALRVAASPAPLASTLAISRILLASSAAARTMIACWAARSVRSPVVPATSSVDAVISSVDAAISCAIAAASAAVPWIVSTRTRSCRTIAKMLCVSMSLPSLRDSCSLMERRSPCDTRCAIAAARPAGLSTSLMKRRSEEPGHDDGAAGHEQQARHQRPGIERHSRPRAAAERSRPGASATTIAGAREGGDVEVAGEAVAGICHDRRVCDPGWRCPEATDRDAAGTGGAQPATDPEASSGRKRAPAALLA